MNLTAQYDAAIASGEINDDPSQRALLAPMQRLIDELTQAENAWWPWTRNRFIQGIYLYGPVGVGKTYLVDLLYQSVEVKKKARFHFHHFMQQIDVKLRQLQGQKDPLKRIAKEMAQSIRLLCFDEFLVHDVAYAMILSQLFQELYANGIVFVFSSNIRPDDLYLNGVQRDRFLPVIALINKKCAVYHLHESKDYRLGHQPLLEAWLHPLNAKNQAKMEAQFALLAKKIEPEGLIDIQNRPIAYLKRGSQAIWFVFDILCNLPRSQLDYLELADRFDTIFLSDIPCLTKTHTLQVIMFIHFIDVMYDRGVNVIISAAVAVEQLYVSGEMQETFKRTLSRLIEMQSVDYLSRHPRRQAPDLFLFN